MTPEDSRKEREARSLALERAYVHDVYDQISVHFSGARYRAWPRVRQFLADLEPGSFVADVGCGNGKYLHINPQIVKVGVDRCLNLATTARDRGHEVTLSDTLALPFRDECVDAALSIAVIHHLATTERRVRALRELARVLKIGGRLMITVWAMEQRHRKFESQDVLVPWHRPDHSSSDDKTSSIERDLNSTTTDDDDLLHYHAHNHSDSDSCPSHRYGSRKNGRRRTRSRAIDPVGAASSSQSSSDLSSPNESCYSFVRRALQKLTSSRRGSSGSGKSWFMHGGMGPFKSDGPFGEAGGSCEPRPSLADDRPSVSNDGSLDSQDNLDDVPIELRHLEPEDPSLLDIPLSPLPALPQPQANRQQSTNEAATTSAASDCEGKAKSKSLTDLVQGAPCEQAQKSVSREGLESSGFDSASVLRSKSSSSCLSLSSHELSSEVLSGALKKIDVKNDTGSKKGLSGLIGTDGLKMASGLVGKLGESLYGESGESVEGRLSPSRKRPALRKQKASIQESETAVGPSSDTQEPTIVIEISRVPAALRTKHSKLVPHDSEEEEEENDEDKDHLNIPKSVGLGIFKQSSLNDEIICIDRFLEKEKLKQSIQKQSSLNEDLIYGNRGGRKESLRESLFATQFRRLQNIRESFQRLRSASLDRFEREKSSDSSSFKKSLMKLLQSWKSEILITKDSETSGASESDSREGERGRRLDSDLSDRKHDLLRARAQSLCHFGRGEGSAEEGVERTCAGGVEKKLLGREPSERKPSREESSDSSKENSFQSDTSLDSEDSCVSVIFIPKPGQAGLNESDKERNRSVSSESSEGSDKQHSPKSPRSPKSPKSPGGAGTSGNRYFAPTRFLGAKPGVKSGPKMGTQVLGGGIGKSESPQQPQQRHISPPLAETAEEGTAPGPTPVPVLERTMSEGVAVREMPGIRTIARTNGISRGGGIRMGDGSSLSRVMSHCGSTPPATPPPTKISGSYFQHPIPTVTRDPPPQKTNQPQNQPQKPNQPQNQPQKPNQPQNQPQKTNTQQNQQQKTNTQQNQQQKTNQPQKTNQLQTQIQPQKPNQPQPPESQPNQTIQKTTELSTTTTNTTPTTSQIPASTTTKTTTTTTTKMTTTTTTTTTTTPATTSTTTTMTTTSPLKPIPKYEPQVVKRDTSFTQQLSSLLLGENIEIIRKKGNGVGRNVQIVRKTVPRFLTFDVFNPETDDLDSDSSASSSPNSGSSVIEKGWPTERDIEELDKEIKRKEEEERRKSSETSGASSGGTSGQGGSGPPPSPPDMPKLSLVEDVHRMDTISEDARENSGSDMNNKRNRSSLSSMSLSRSSTTTTASTRTFADQAVTGGLRREVDALKQRSVSMSVVSDGERRSQLSQLSSSTSASSLLASCSSLSSSSSSSLLLSSAMALSPSSSSLESASEMVTKRSPKGRRKLTIAHLDQPQPPLSQTSDSKQERRHTRSPEPLLERQGIRGRIQQSKALSPMEAMGRGDMKPWAEMAIKPLTETVSMPPSGSWRAAKYSPESILKGIADFEKIQKKDKKGGLDLPFGAPARSNLSPSSSVSSTSPSLSRAELPGREDAGTRSPLLSSPTPSTSSGESRSEPHIAMSLFRDGGPFSLDVFKMNRSESSIPLLSPEESQANHGIFKDPIKTKETKIEVETGKKSKSPEKNGVKKEKSEKSEKVEKAEKTGSALKPKRSHTGSLKVRIEDTKNLKKDDENGGKIKCRLCARENDKRQQKKKQEQLTSLLTSGRHRQSEGHRSDHIRGELRSQGSLDSAKEKESHKSAPLMRSGSLDLEKAERSQRDENGGLTRDLSTSQDSLQSDIGGAPTLHRYYHVFREGELDQLIEKYVHNLHIISSYYDHANWCVIAEKVQVWTI